MGKHVLYNGKGEGDPRASLLERCKPYEVVYGTLNLEQNVVILKDMEGTFNEDWFDECIDMGFGTKVMKPSYFAKATLYMNDMRFYIGLRLNIRRLEKKEKFKKLTTSPVQKIEQVYGNIYKIETENSVYITEVQKRTVG